MTNYIYHTQPQNMIKKQTQKTIFYYTDENIYMVLEFSDVLILEPFMI